MSPKTFIAGQAAKRSWVKPALITLAVLAGLALAGAGGAFAWYQISLRPRDPAATTKQLVMIESGMAADAISDLLEDKGLIRSSTAMSFYAARTGVKTRLQAGTYEFSPNLSVAEIVDKLVRGDIAKRSVTFAPGRRLDQLRLVMIEAGFDEKAVDAALKSAGRQNLAGILPDEATLEGYLFAETYSLPLDKGPDVVVSQATRQLAKQLTDEVKVGIKAQGLTINEAVILASIVQQESKSPAEQRQIAQVFLKRLREGIRLGADPTFRYAAAILGVEPSTTINSPYNTRLHAGLPPGPIGSFNGSALMAVADPAEGDYLYFVAGDDGITRFSRTLQEHNELKAKYCIEACKL